MKISDRVNRNIAAQIGCGWQVLPGIISFSLQFSMHLTDTERILQFPLSRIRYVLVTTDQYKVIRLLEKQWEHCDLNADSFTAHQHSIDSVPMCARNHRWTSLLLLCVPLPWRQRSLMALLLIPQGGRTTDVWRVDIVCLFPVVNDSSEPQRSHQNETQFVSPRWSLSHSL